MRYCLTRHISIGSLLLAIAILTPLEVSAQLTNLQLLVFRLGDLVRIAIPVLVGVALLVFFWGLVRFIFRAGNEEERKKGRQVMLWGIVALFVMVSIWGIVQFIASALYIPTGPVYYPVSGGSSGRSSQPIPSSSGSSFPTSGENTGGSRSIRDVLQGS